MATAELEPGTTLQDTYRIVRRIGAGGMGEVYEATHARLAGRYAVKVLLREVAANPEAYARFQREAETTSSLRHPNIVQVVDFNVTPDGAPYLVMEYLEGTDLATSLGQSGPMPLPQVARIVKQIAAGLGAAHLRGVVHRDLKPQNIFLVAIEGEAEEFAKVVDFGISKVRSATRALTRESAVIGTPQYMSPEQALGQVDQIDARTDQFALAALTYEMLTGRDAFTGDSLLAIMYQVVHNDPANIVGSSAWGTPELEAVLRRAMSKRKDDRFPSIQDYARALEAVAARTPHPTLDAIESARRSAREWAAYKTQLSTRPSIEGTPTPPPPTEGGKPTTFRSTASEIVVDGSPRRRRPRWAVPAGVGAGVTLALVLFAALRSGGPSPTKAVAPAVPAPSALPSMEPMVVHEPAPAPAPTPSSAPTRIDSRVRRPPRTAVAARPARREERPESRPVIGATPPGPALAPTPPPKKPSNPGLVKGDEL